MSAGGYESVLFDFDGTITRPFFDWSLMKEEMGFEEDLSILDYLAEAEEPERSRVESVLNRHEAAARDAAELGEGVRAILDYLSSRSVPVGIVTNNSAANVNPVLERFDLQFRAVVTRDIGCWKPDPRQVIEACKAIGDSPSRVILIGDGRYDMLAGRAAGTHTIGLLNGPWKREEFAALCDHTVDSLIEAIPILDQLIQRPRRM